jgi:excisionase family DNA binding protein
MTEPGRTELAPLLTIPDVADYCRVSTKTIRRWITANDLVAIKLGNQWRITPNDLDRFIRLARNS